MFFPGGFQKIKQSFFLDQRNALPLITKHDEIVSGLDVEYFSGFCRDYDLTFLTYFYHAKNVFSFRWNFQPKRILFFIIDQVIHRHAKDICEPFAPFDIRQGFPRLP